MKTVKQITGIWLGKQARMPAIFLITETKNASKTHPQSSHDKFRTVYL
ncbi:hypothetical protein [Bacteroides gallinaceum]|nr:hypothetical protein [Bacteroides gallinaceum]MDN0064907.1 hypothetical protein [Bacteroides gallinaceum]